MTGRGPRVGVGILLIVVGVVSAASAGVKPQIGSVETATYYVAAFLLFAAGLWLILRGRGRKKDA